MKNNEYLGTEPVGKLLFRLALPAITAQIINMLYNLVDRIFIGHIPYDGAAALTGMGVCLPIILLVSAFAALVSMGSAPKASIFMGKKDNESAEKIMGNSFVLLLGISVVLTAVVLIWKTEILYFFGASENTIGYASDYLSIYAIGTVFVQIALGMNAFITAQGFAKTSMLTVLIGAVLNIGLDPLFIYVFKMGVKGAAIATVISQAASTLLVLLFLFSKKTILKLRVKHFRIYPRLILPCIALGIAPFVMQSTESVVIVCFNSSLKLYGGDIAVGAMTILASIMQFAMLPLQGLGQGAQPIASYNYGAGDGARVKAVFKRLLIADLIYAGTIWLLVMLAPKIFAGIFTSDTELLEFTAPVLRIFMASSVLMGIQMACQMIIISMGKAFSSVFIACLRKLVLLIPLIYILPAVMADKLTAVYIAEPIADAVAVSCTVVIFAFQFKSAMKNIPKNNLSLNQLVVNLVDNHLTETIPDIEDNNLPETHFVNTKPTNDDAE